MHAHPAVVALYVAAVMIRVIAAAAPFAFAGDGRARSRTDHRADSRTAATTHGSADDSARGSAQESTAKCVLRHRLMRRHCECEAEHGRHPKLPNHFRILLCDPKRLLALALPQVNKP